MTLAQIMTLALRQLDEDAQDISEYDDAFRVYANTGYGIAVREYLKPRERFSMRTDARGEADLPYGRIVRVVELREKTLGREAAFTLTADGGRVITGAKNAELDALCEVYYPEMTQETDEPMLPEHAHHALADYICYRHLSSGSMAKQSRAQFFLTSFYTAMRAIRPQGMGSVKDYKNLYEATDVRVVR